MADALEQALDDIPDFEIAPPKMIKSHPPVNDQQAAIYGIMETLG